MIELRFRGRVADLSETDRRALVERSTSTNPQVVSVVSLIIAEVRDRGDAALFDLASRFDASVPPTLEVPRARMRRALNGLAKDVRRAMDRSARNVAAVHRGGLPRPACILPEPGIEITRRPDPLDRVGIYAPGGSAAYPSSVLMTAIPARVAGVREVILCSPPTATGWPSELVLAGAALAEVDRVFAVGGAGAVAAMAYGTNSVPRVDRIVGPGNTWVAEAKLQVVGAVAIDAPAGPSELLVIVDDGACAEIVALEMLAQAEHDPAACVVAVCVGESVARNVEQALSSLLPGRPREDIVRRALAGQGGVVIAETRADAVVLANAYAPEHLLLAGGAGDLAGRIRGAGTIFIGETSSVSFGDYLTGANHVLPTGGLARAYSGLSVLDFIRWTTTQRIDPSAAASLAADTSVFADAEGLPGHAIAAARWRTA